MLWDLSLGKIDDINDGCISQGSPDKQKQLNNYNRETAPNGPFCWL